MPKPKLTPEEKKARRIQKKLERKQRLAERKKQGKRDHLEREVKYGALTLKRHEKEWRQMLIKIALPRMRQELEFAWHNFERVIDAKDFTISLLMDELTDSEEQYMLNFKTHDENLAKLMRMFHDRLDELREDNRKAVADLESRSNSEVENIMANSNDNLEYLKTMLYSLEVKNKEQERMLRAEYYSRLDEEDVKNHLALQKLKGGLEAAYQKLFDDTKAFLKDFNKRTKERRKEHNALKTQDDQMQELIAFQLEQIRKSYELIKFLRQKLADLRQVEGHRLLDLEAEKEYFWTTFLELKNTLEYDRRTDMEHLIHLTKSCNLAFEYLEKLRDKGKKILTLSAICRKLETQKEKILPFPLLDNTATDPVKDDTHNDVPVKDDDDNMMLFWQRYGNVGALKYAIDEEKRFLSSENNVIVGKFHEHCNKEKFPNVEPIFKNEPKCSKDNIIYANLEVEKYEKHLK